ncbi:MAG: hypothetical protein HY718_03505 [Planctomycetes bacterium]|nr:hypothetical protein [Planctomycetota bacterium]
MHTKLRLWDALILVAGLTLVVSFFLPTFTNQCSTTPAYLIRWELYDWWCGPNMPISEIFFTFCSLAACHLFGGLIALVGAARLAGRPRLARALAVPLTILLALVGAGLLWTGPVYHDEAFRCGEWWSLPGTMVGGLAILSYLTWASRFGLQAARFHEFAAALAAVGYFSLLSCSLPVSYGPYVSLAASTLLLVGTVGTARAMPRDSWWTAVWQLMTCQLKDKDVTSERPSGGVCPECGEKSEDRPLPRPLKSPIA